MPMSASPSRGKLRRSDGLFCKKALQPAAVPFVNMEENPCVKSQDTGISIALIPRRRTDFKGVHGELRNRGQAPCGHAPLVHWLGREAGGLSEPPPTACSRWLSTQAPYKLHLLPHRQAEVSDVCRAGRSQPGGEGFEMLLSCAALHGENRLQIRWFQ